ncbi:MAG TPA: histidine kinase dimerization/phosphoacceptor domain -containing protein [Allosphingosinicella sp.]|nr:histidine kinase dimerization/phosphoacceptor domain -containing protein [Allosphingosinicella sp.]
MTAPSIIPDDEAGRMAAVNRYDILDTPADGSFDRITAIAARRFDVPIAIISIVDHDRIWFKSHHGLDVAEIGRDPGLCASAILSSDPHILTDASADPRSLANPLVAGDFGLRFYAGVPLKTADGYNLGTLCVIDKAPRPIDQDQIDDLRDLASVVVDQLELRLSARRAVAQAQLLAREIDHRVMNSLQFVSGLLTMQSRDPAVSAAAAQLQEAATRVAAVACVHRNFYSDETEDVSCLTFLGRLCADLSGICGRPVEVEGDEARVPTTWIQPIGLITNELVTNAAKHGQGRILVSYRVDGPTHSLSVCDEGKGLPGEFDPSLSKGLGMKVVTTLARQLGGQIKVAPIPDGSGSCISVTFSA